MFKNSTCKYDNLIETKDVLYFPMFVNEEYNIKVIDITREKELETINIVPTFKRMSMGLQSILVNQKIQKKP